MNRCVQIILLIAVMFGMSGRAMAAYTHDHAAANCSQSHGHHHRCDDHTGSDHDGQHEHEDHEDSEGSSIPAEPHNHACCFVLPCVTADTGTVLFMAFAHSYVCVHECDTRAPDDPFFALDKPPLI